jgi:ABC-type branched-subunit amino acid transport system substrate-binding protein
MKKRLSLVLSMVAIVVSSSVLVATAFAHRDNRLAGQPFKVLVMYGVNAIANNAPNMGAAIQASAADVDKTGGIGGRPLVVELCNHQGTLNGAADCARQAVADNVDDVMLYSTFDTLAVPILTAAKIPMIGGIISAQTDYNVPSIVPLTGGTTPLWMGCVYLAKSLGAKNIATVQTDTASSYALIASVKSAASAAGLKFLGNVVTPLTLADWSPIAAQMQQLAPDFETHPITTASTVALLRAEQTLGFHTKHCTHSQLVLPSDLQAAGSVTDGLYAVSTMPPATATNLPGVRKFVAAMQAANISDLGESDMIGWLFPYALQALAKTIKGPVTSASILKAAHTAKNLNLQGLLNWSPGQKGPAPYPNSPNGQVWFNIAQGGSYHLIRNKPFDVWKTMGIARS